MSRRTGAMRAKVLLGVLGVLPPAAWARDMGPPVRWLAFRDLGGSLELQYEEEEHDLRTRGSGDGSSFRDRRFHEILTLNTLGYVYHPRLLDFRASVGVELQQADVTLSQPGDNRRTRDHFSSPEYSISGVFFAEHPISLSFGAERSSRTELRDYADLYTVDSEDQHATLTFKSERMPVELFFEHTKRNEWQSGVGESDFEEETRYGFNITRLDGPSTSHAHYDRLDSTQEVFFPGAATTRSVFKRSVDTVTLDNTLRFGREQRSSLASRASFSDEQGSYPRTRLTLAEYLHLQHFDPLWSDYGVNYSRDTFSGQMNDITTGTASLSHQLYESLLSRLTLRGEKDEYGDSDRTRYGGDLDFSYRKKIPRGTLFLDFGGGRDVTAEGGSGTQRQVFDESHTLADLDTTFLNNPDVVTSTVTVTAANNITVYLPGVDYELLPVGNLTQIRRIVGGAIPDGGAVLVDYAYTISGPMKYTTQRWHGGVRLDLFDQLLNLYARRSSSINHVTEGNDAGRLDDVVDTLYGAALRVAPFSLTVEHNIHDSTLVPYVSDMVSATYQETFHLEHTLSAAASWRRVVYSGQIAAAGGDTATTTSLSGSYRFVRPFWPSLGVALGFDNRDDRGTKTRRAFGRLQAKYQVRAAEFALTIWLRHRESNTTLEDSSYVFFSVKRKF